MIKMANTGQKLWEKAKTIIPGGNQLLSKRSELFLPKHWPSYYKKEKGCEIWNLDYDVERYLYGPVKHTTFARLTD